MLEQAPELGTAQLFAIALLIGALVGVEREKNKLDKQRPSFAGIRTFILLAEAGALSAWLSQNTGIPLIFAVTLGGLVLLIAAAYVLERRADPTSIGLTTELAALTVFLLGAAVMSGHAAVAVGLAVVNASLLAFKGHLHGAVQKLGKDDIYAGLKLLIASFIVLPLLPHTPVDPWGVLNPWKLWLLVILISGLSLIGYVATRCLGSVRGVAVTGLTGGLVSSTAVTLSMARESRLESGAGREDAFAAGVLIAWSVMFARVVLMVLLLAPALLAPLLWPFGLMLAANSGFAVWFYVLSQQSSTQQANSMGAVPLKNPFSLWSASKFGLLFAAVLLLVELSRRSFPESGLVPVAVLAGATDVDAITLSMIDLAGKSGVLLSAAQAIVAAALSNTVVKAGMCIALGSPGMARRMGTATLVVLVVGAVAAFAA